MPANVANGTNRLGILFQTITSTLSFRKHGYFQFRRGLIIAAPAVVGSFLGAMIAVDLNEDLMRKAIGILLLVMVVLILIKPERWFGQQQENLFRMGFWQGIALFFVGIYGGFIQAGVGFFLLGTLVLGIKTDLVSGNAYMNFTVLCLTISALVIFFANHQVRVLQVSCWLWVVLPEHGPLPCAVRKGARFIGWFLWLPFCCRRSVAGCFSGWVRSLLSCFNPDKFPDKLLTMHWGVTHLMHFPG
jgi:uncharacterized membrane protein YfcA